MKKAVVAVPLTKLSGDFKPSYGLSSLFLSVKNECRQECELKTDYQPRVVLFLGACGGIHDLARMWTSKDNCGVGCYRPPLCGQWGLNSFARLAGAAPSPSELSHWYPELLLIPSG